MDTPLRVGDILHGFCGGMFGRDSYEDKRVEAIGADWVVTRRADEFSTPALEFCAGDPERLRRYRQPEDSDWRTAEGRW
jgi:hypothetical protein